VSANDAAVALATHKYSLEDFVVLMNQKADSIGMKDTRFKDPSGLEDEGLSSAYDMGLLLSYCLKNPVISQIIRTPEKTIYNLDRSKEYRLENSNRLVKEEMYLKGIIGGKTGFTPEAGHILATAASRDGHTLIAVIINTHLNTKEASALAARDLLNWGFANWEWKRIDA
jgi:D-alanyl-D-alanine carboxypeptidase